MALLSPVKLGIIILSGFLPLLLIRQFLLKSMVATAGSVDQPLRAFLLDFSICLAASFIVNGYNYFILGFPLFSLVSFTIGCLMAGFFIGLESSLSRERTVIESAIQEGANLPLPEKIFSITRKYMLVASTTTLFVAVVLILVFVRDIDWLVRTTHDAAAMKDARLSVLYEILFIMGVLLLLIINLILSYSKNLKLLFHNQTLILERVREGDLSQKVPVATRDEFGVIAGHTNHMIEGLRHRFELISDLRLAEEVQQNLLPSKSPYLLEYDVSGASIYCDQTGGDYFDYFLLPENKFGIVVADACGHGVGAAMLMTSVRAYLVSAVENYDDPASLMKSVNTLLVKDCSANSTFITLFFLELDQNRKAIRWIRAGHEPALLYRRRTGRFSELSGPGLVLGVEDLYQFEVQSEHDLESGDIILVGTDGIQETFNGQEQFGKERIREVMENFCDEPAHIIQENLVEKVQQFRDGHKQEDDITLVVVKVK